VAGTTSVWALPFALSIDNITFGVIDGHWTTNVWGQAAQQALSSALQAGIGIALSVWVVSRSQSSAAASSAARRPDWACRRGADRHGRSRAVGRLITD
jgi:hypothetical protein